MCIYKIQNNASGEVYIGKTIRHAFWRWTEHCTSKNASKISRALRKYGQDGFTFSVIDIAENIESLTAKEIFWIAQYSSVAPHGYNLNGGEDQPASAEFKEYMSKIVFPRVFGRPSRKTVKESRTEVDIFWMKMRIELLNSLKQTGKPILKNRVPIVRSDGVNFNGIVDAATQMGVNENSIRRVLKGKRNSIKGFAFTYYKEET